MEFISEKGGDERVGLFTYSISARYVEELTCPWDFEDQQALTTSAYVSSWKNGTTKTLPRSTFAPFSHLWIQNSQHWINQEGKTVLQMGRLKNESTCVLHVISLMFPPVTLKK